MASPKFGYWGLQGLGQPVRMLLAHQGVDHEDTVYTMEGSATWFEDHKLNMGLDFPNLPYYVDGDLKLTQSMAILRHLGREHGLYGQDNKEASKIDMIMDLAGDMRLGLARLAYNPDFVRNLEKSNFRVDKINHFSGESKGQTYRINGAQVQTTLDLFGRQAIFDGRGFDHCGFHYA